VLFNGEAMDALPRVPRDLFDLLVTTELPEDPGTPPPLPVIYFPVLSTAFGEMTPESRAAWDDLHKGLVEVAGQKARTVSVAHMFSRCDRVAREMLPRELEARGLLVTYLGACQGAGREEVRRALLIP